MKRAEVRRLGARGGALAILVGLCALVWFGLVAPWSVRRADLFARIANADAARIRFEASLDGAGPGSRPILPENLTIKAPSLPLAIASLQQRVNAEILASGGQRDSVLALEPEIGAEVAILRLRVEGSFDMDQTAALLHNLETTAPLVFVDRLELNRSRDPAGPETPVALDLRLTVSTIVDLPNGRSGTDP